MSKELHADLNGHSLRIGIVVSTFNQVVTSRLLEGAKEGLLRHKVDQKDITVVHVPGAFEIPLVAKRLCKTNKYHAVICLGAVIRGETPHFEYVSSETSHGIASVALETGVPVIFGVLTTENMTQAMDRAGGSAGNKGYEAAVAAVQMANTLKAISEQK